MEREREKYFEGKVKERGISNVMRVRMDNVETEGKGEASTKASSQIALSDLSN